MKQLELNLFENTLLPETKEDKITPTYFQDKIPKSVVEKKIATMGDPKSNGAWKNFVDKNDKFEKEKLNNLKNKNKPITKVKELSGNSGSEHHSGFVGDVALSAGPGKEKPRQENITERIDRIKYEYNDSNKRPAHLDNKNIYSFEDSHKKAPGYPTRATPEQFGKLAERVERQRQMSGGPDSWEMFKETADTPEERNELKRMLNKDYYKYGPKNMDPSDLKFIGKHKSQTAPIKIEIPRVSIDETLFAQRPKISEIPIEQQIKVLADQRLEREQKAWDNAHGQAGIANILRPK